MQGIDFSTRSSDGFDLENIISLELDQAFALVFGPCLGVLRLSTLLSVRIPAECCIKQYIEEQDKTTNAKIHDCKLYFKIKTKCFQFKKLYY